MLAKIQGVFRLTRDLELRYLQDGTPVAKLGLACSEKYKEKETTLFLEASVFGKISEILNQYAGSKGAQIFLTGKLKTEQWEKDGQKHSKIVMMIEDFQFVEKRDAQPQQNQAPTYHHEQIPQDNQYQKQEMPSADSVPTIDVDLDDLF